MSFPGPGQSPNNNGGEMCIRDRLKEARKTRMTIQEVGGVKGTAERT